MKERVLEAIHQRIEQKLAGPGRPGTADEAGWQKVERREAQRPPSMGARGLTVPREVGPLIPPQRVPRKHSGASHRSTPSLRFARDWQTSDALRRENAKPCPSFRGACALCASEPGIQTFSSTSLDSGFAPKRRAPE